MKNFVNLTNGIEIIPHLDDFSFIRIQSTTLESRNWYKLFSDLDHNFLMWLAMGEECIVYDFGCCRTESRVIHMGFPIIQYCINRYWFGTDSDCVIMGRAKVNCVDFVREKIYDRYFIYHDEQKLPAKISLNEKYKYYRKWLKPGIKRVNLVGASQSTSHDGDWDYYSGILNG